MFLGHKISKGSVRMDEAKVNAIMDWEQPKSVPELRSFLGLANYYRKFIKGYSQKVSSLTDLLKKSQVWEWTERCQSAFEDLKSAISSEPVLKLPEFDKPFEVHTDASGRAIGGVLVQEGHPVAFEGRKLKDAEERYSTHEKEMLAVVHCLRIWRHYLLGTKFIVLTDNVANTFFQSQKNLSPKQARWMEFLEEYDFTWQHKPGKHNMVPDALSRKTQEVFAAISAVESDFTKRVREESENDAEYVRLSGQVKDGSVRRYWIENGLLLTKGLHPTFHVSYLKPYHEDVEGLHPTCKRNPPTIRKQFTKEVEMILDRRVLGQSKKNRRIEYLVRWKDCPETEVSWERDTTLWQFEDKVEEYLTRASSSSSGGGL
ncbi:hypothetical protein BVRB_4g072900 [Beta vulgaris subsp. vulgaris]|nr:hypothetical protein BVRB_4g072900 [Beta vulgaris subsp. vulgaris]